MVSYRHIFTNTYVMLLRWGDPNEQEFKEKQELYFFFENGKRKCMFMVRYGPLIRIYIVYKEPNYCLVI